MQTEIERVKFIVRSYVRTRLFKVRLASPVFVSIVIVADTELDDWEDREIRSVRHLQR